MGILCKFGFHTWDGCKCSKCGKTRNEEHNWSKDCEECSKCGKTKDEGHDWSKDCEKCVLCGRTREGAHQWSSPQLNSDNDLYEVVRECSCCHAQDKQSPPAVGSFYQRFLKKLEMNSQTLS